MFRALSSWFNSTTTLQSDPDSNVKALRPEPSDQDYPSSSSSASSKLLQTDTRSKKRFSTSDMELRVPGAFFTEARPNLKFFRCVECNELILLSAVNEHAVNCGLLHEGEKFEGSVAVCTVEGEESRRDCDNGFICSVLDDPSQLKMDQEAPQILQGPPDGTTPIDYDSQCGVAEKNTPCSHSLTCEDHSLKAKRAVVGRSRPYDELLARLARNQNLTVLEQNGVTRSSSSHGQYMTQSSYSEIAEQNPQSVLSASTTFQHLVNPTITNAMFNNLTHGNQYNQNIYIRDLLWDAISDVKASHNAELQAGTGRGCCQPGTREKVLKLIHEWSITGCQTLPVCWLSGAAGVGKSAIALTVAKEWEKAGLVASFSFS
ncbi:SCA7-domain-containing protein [Marasmius fiardii PR-910]|nr:SCA7-domain-containing protein [Marasmius fiardii PR-910]